MGPRGQADSARLALTFLWGNHDCLNLNLDQTQGLELGYNTTTPCLTLTFSANTAASRLARE